MIPLAMRLATNSPPDRRRRCSGGIHAPPCILLRRCPRQANPLLVVDELIREPSKELKAAWCPVVRMDDLLEKKAGIDADDAKHSKVEPLVPILGGKIAAHPKYPNLLHPNPYGIGGGRSAPSLGLSPGQYTSLFCNLTAAEDRLYQGGGGSGDSLQDGHGAFSAAMNAKF